MSEWILWLDVKRVPSETARLARRRARSVARALSWVRLKQSGSDERKGGRWREKHSHHSVEKSGLKYRSAVATKPRSLRGKDVCEVT